MPRCSTMLKRPRASSPLALLLLLWLHLPLSFAQQSPSQVPKLDIDTTVTQRFVAVHGRRSLVMGYPREGLEIWGYPLQILSGYQIGFQGEGETTEIDARLLLRRLVYAPDSVTRIYVGADYVVRETLFVPLDQPAAILTYQVESRRKVNIVVHFTPVLDLMWPGGLGGQVTQWKPAVNGYVLSQYSEHLSAVIASLDIHAFDSTVNSTYNNGKRFSFTLQPHIVNATTHQSSSTASVYIALDPSGGENPAAVVQALAAHTDDALASAAAHYRDLRQEALQIETPDSRVNSAIAWAQIALDQAWVCNPRLGCGLVAGYGPSREIRRPQYAWFFGGDGLAATNALIAAGDFSRAREELEFIMRYQDQKTGMIWHELSQSAGYIDWSKYPYMFVHVDISLDYLNTVARYVKASGDTPFASAHWPSLLAAYTYSRSLVSPADRIPHIPPDKEGGDEQHRPADDLGVSSGWVAAAQSFADLAGITGHPREAQQASAEAGLARSAIAAHFWNAKENFWIDGHTGDGSPIFTRRSGFSSLLAEHVFTPQQDSAVLDQIASSQFVTDWGVRGAAPTADYDPWSYTTAITSVLQTSDTALAFWQNHRPDVAESIWRDIIPLNLLDSPGHLLEVLSGNLYIEQTESVPEQTWSSAGFLDATLRGLFGLELDGAQNSVTFSPRIPADWDHVSLRRIALPHAKLSFDLHQTTSTIDLAIHNDGQAASIHFTPQIPLGARLVSAVCEGEDIPAHSVDFPEEQQAELQFRAPPGDRACHLQISGGVSLILPSPAPEIGDASKELKLTGLRLKGSVLSIDMDVTNAVTNAFLIRTPLKVGDITGATARELSPEIYQIQPATPTGTGYRSSHIDIVLK